MRTTLTIDADVAAQLEDARRIRRATFKQVVNEALREGLQVMNAGGKASRKPFRMEPFDYGEPRLPNLDNIAEVLAFAEGEAFK